MEGINNSESLGYFFDIYWEELGSERMSFPWVVIKCSEFKGTEKKDNGVDFECIFGPRKCGDMLEVESWLWVVEGVIDFGSFLFADVKIVILRRVEEGVDGWGLNFDVIEWPEDYLVAKSWLFDFHWFIINCKVDIFIIILRRKKGFII